MTPKTINYEFEVTEIRYGQERPYGDSYYEYVVKTSLPEAITKKFCTKVLYPSELSKEQWKQRNGDLNVYFAGYYTFEKISDNEYRYVAMRPFCD